MTGLPSPLLYSVPLEHGDGLRLIGELDLSTVDALRAMVDTLPAGAHVLDLGGLSFMDSSGLHAFERYAQTLNGSSPLVLENVPSHVRRLFEIAGVDQNPDIELRSDSDHG